MSRREFSVRLRVVAGLLVAGGLCLAELPGQEPPPPPEAPQSERGGEQQRTAPQEGSGTGVGLGIDVVSTPQGVFVAGVREDGPAANVGLQRGDQIVSFAGEPVTRAEDLLSLIAEQQAESTVQAQVRRRGERMEMAIVLGSGESAQDRNLSQEQDQEQQHRARQGQEAARSPSPAESQPQQGPRAPTQRSGERQQTARYQPPPVWAGFLLERAPLGVVIERLHPEGPARRARLRVGDRIVRVNGRVIAEPEEVYAAIEQRQPGEDLQLTVLRGEELLDGAIRVESPPPGVAEQPADGFGAGTREMAQLVEQQRQNTEMIQELLQEVRMLRQELEELRSGRRRVVP